MVPMAHLEPAHLGGKKRGEEEERKEKEVSLIKARHRRRSVLGFDLANKS